MKPPRRCLCGKLWAPTCNAAQRLHRMVVKRAGGGDPVRFYICRYRGWHWSRQVDRQPTRIGAEYERALAEHRDAEQQQQKEIPVDGIKIEWVEEVPNTMVPTDDTFQVVIDELKKHPGRWARIGEPSTHASVVKPWKKRLCEAKARRSSNSRDGKPLYDLYVRWPADGAEGLVGSVSGSIVTVRPDKVTPRMKAQTELREESHRQAYAATVPDAVTIIDPDGVTTTIDGVKVVEIRQTGTSTPPYIPHTVELVESHGVPVRDIARTRKESEVSGGVPPEDPLLNQPRAEKEPEDVGDDSVRQIIAEGRNGYVASVQGGKATLVPPNPKTPAGKKIREQAAAVGIPSDVEPDVPPVSVPTAPRRASEKELQTRSAALSSGQKRDVVEEMPVRREGESGAAFEFRLARWKRKVPTQGKSAAAMRTR